MGRFDSSITLHDTIERRVQLPIVNLRNAEFTTTVSVGSPSKDLSLIIDTLSSNTWVYSKKCWSITCWWKDKYNPRFSTEEQKISNTKAKISYFQGSVTGKEYYETFSMTGDFERDVT